MVKSKPRGLRNNNPGNIRQSSVRYTGEVQPSKDGAFKQFQSMEYGYRAMFVLLHTYARKHGINTIEGMISRYAPATENHTRKYIDVVSEWSGVPATSHLTTTNAEVMIPIVAAMSRVENGVEAVMAEVEKGWQMFINDYRNHLV
ncbi:MAG: structural protein P5 [Alistipes sp.]|nr:structural protein P5 [Alistipes sp.]